MSRSASSRWLAWAIAAVVVAVAAFAVMTWRDLAPVPAALPPHRVAPEPELLARDGERLTDSHGGFNYDLDLPLTAIPRLLRTGFVFSEDRRYWRHGGSDWRARFAALWQNLDAGHIVRGASTIGEQVARIITPRPRTYWSHWLEGIEAGRLIGRFGRSRVLDFYLNQVPYGARRRGVAEAAHYYFGSEVRTLDPAEQLALVVLVRSPRALDPRRHPRALRRAVDALAVRMRERGLIETSELRAVRRSPLVAAPAPGLPVVAGAFVGFVRSQIRGLGLRAIEFKTTLDADLQRFAQQTLATRLAALRGRGVRNAAALVVDNESGAVLAWASAPAAAAYDLDPVTTPRQPGSALKPFLYSLALQRLGWQPFTVLRDGPLSTQIGDGVHQYHNFSYRYYGRVSLRYALGNSLNIPAVETAEAVGVVPFMRLLGRLGVTTLTRPADYYGPAVAIGDGPVSLYELVQAYSALARHGLYLPLHVLEGQPEPAPVAVLRPDVTSVIASILSDPNARRAEFGPYSVLDLPFPTAVKTGTSSDFRDAFAVGFDDRYTIGVWMGRLAGGNMDRITGSAGPALVLRTLFAHLRQMDPYAGLWRSPELRRVRTCEHIGAGPCIAREDWQLNIGMARPERPATRPLRIMQPLPGEVLAIDPRIPITDQVYSFQLRGAHRPRTVNWYLDGRWLGRTDSRQWHWPLAPGAHALSVRVRLAHSRRVVRLGPVPFQVEGSVSPSAGSGGGR